MLIHELRLLFINFLRRHCVRSDVVNTFRGLFTKFIRCFWFVAGGFWWNGGFVYSWVVVVLLLDVDT